MKTKPLIDSSDESAIANTASNSQTSSCCSIDEPVGMRNTKTNASSQTRHHVILSTNKSYAADDCNGTTQRARSLLDHPTSCLRSALPLNLNINLIHQTEYTSPSIQSIAKKSQLSSSTSTSEQSSSAIARPVRKSHHHHNHQNQPRSLSVAMSSRSSSSNSNNSSSLESSLVDPAKIHLFVKAGQDGRSQGACPFCQDVFMQLLIKAQANKFNFDVITINMDNPPKEFRELSIKPPVLIQGVSRLLAFNDSPPSRDAGSTTAVMLADVDDIADYLDRLYPNSMLNFANIEAKKVCLNVFSKFSFFIRDVASASTGLEAELEKIDTYLRETSRGSPTKFMCGAEMTLLDCSLLPKLQHIRVAGEAIKKFRIPARFQNLWTYLRNAYESDAFRKACPPDREIIWNWAKNFLTKRDLLQLVQETPYKTLTLPDYVKLANK